MCRRRCTPAARPPAASSSTGCATATAYAERSEVREHPVTEDGVVLKANIFRLIARRLDHRVETYGWRLEEHDGYCSSS